ncbi:MAG: AsmA-like C-terminal region-containing protein [Paludibacteraceae bacterium]|nr:AsmA-like C-terminal region-containing protein [Paludibacteraceae bacterium]
MKKIWKVIAWTLVSVVMMVLLVITTACYLIFTPERLTPIVQQVATKFVTCEHEIGEVELTFFSTFPYLGVEIHDVSLIHPIDSLAPDTLAAVEKILLSVQPFDAIGGDIFIKQLAVEGITANIYVSADGRTNYDIIALSDTTEVVEDTTTGWRIQSIGWDEDMTIHARSISYRDDKNQIAASLHHTTIALAGVEKDTLLGVVLDVKAEQIDVCAQGEQYAHHCQFQLHLPLWANSAEQIRIDNAICALNEYGITIDGEVGTPCLSSGEYRMDLRLTTDDWQVQPLLALLPTSITSSLKEIKIDGKAKADIAVQGVYNESQMPHLKARLLLQKGSARYQPLPYDLHHITLDATADIDLNAKQPSKVVIHHLSAKTKESQLKAKGTVNDLLGKMQIDVQMDVDAHLTDWTYFLPDSMLLTGNTKGTVNATIGLDDLLNMRIEKGVFTADVDLIDIHYAQDSLEVDLPMANAKLQIPNQSSHKRRANRSSLSAAIELNAQQAYMSMVDEMEVSAQQLYLTASAAYNKKGENILQQWNPRLVVDIKQGELNLPNRLPVKVYIPSIDFSYSNRKMAIQEAEVVMGRSDLSLKGEIRNIGRWLRHKAVLEGQLDITSTHCDANQLLEWFSAESGAEEQEQVALEPIPEQKDTTMTPFLVPTDVNLALNTHIQEVEVFNQVAKDLKGGIYINDGTVVLDEVGFVCRAAKLQLTAMYRTPRANHLYVGLDYHMIDVDIDELLSIIPEVEQMVPMLSSFKGQAEFHLAAETYLNSQYQPKMSTLRGAASLTGKDLVVLDGETFSTISKLLLFSKKTENKIDSINAEMTIYKNQIDLYPLCVQMDNYMVALGGRHNTNMTFNYDINVLKPNYLGVNVSGTMDDLKIKLAKCKFAEDFRPHWYQKVDTQSLELRQRIKQSMERNVRIQSTK